MPAKKQSKSTGTKTVQKQSSVTAKVQARPWQLVLMSVFSLAMSYGFVSWAIDTGSLWLYLFCFISFYYSLDYFRKFLKVTLFHNEQYKKSTKKTRRA